MTVIRKMLVALMAVVLAFGLLPMAAFADVDFSEVDDVAGGEGPFGDGAEGANGEARGFFDGDAVPVDLASIAFVYVESPSVPANSVENIVIGFVKEDVVVESAQLDIAGPDGAVIALAEDDVVEGAVLFVADASALEKGNYEIRELRYRTGEDDSVYAVSFAQDEEVDYAFEIGDPVDAALDEDGLATEVYTIGVDGEYVETDSIASAMAAAGVDPESGPNSSGSVDGSELSAQASDGFVIVLDPGHGGTDGGATGIGFLEKDVNLKIAQYCKAKLEQTPGVTVYMTRTSDATVSLQERVNFAVSHNADLVVSLHNNASGGRGSEVIVPRNGSWYYDETYVTGTELGKAILGKLNALGLGTHSGVYSRDCTTGETYPDGTLSDYYTLIEGPRYEGILGIIVEHAFVDNASDAAFLNNDASLKRLGEADAQAIVDYYNSSDGIMRLYWGVYDFDYYIAHYPDVKSRYGGSKIQTLGYFKSTGMAAGHRANELFNVNYYKENNVDLQKAYGNDLAKYYQHFMEYGMQEGRQGSADFSAVVYRSNYSDLQAAFGGNWEKYYKHYVEYGIKEGRSGKGTGSATTAATASFNSNAMYRLYNPNSGEHFYTAGASERDYLVRAGWRYEGIAWHAPASSSAPVYRLYNPNAGDHHYTMSAGERDYLVGVGWKYEGIGWYSDDAQGVALYRLYNPNASTGTHHYTTGTGERDYLVQVGWKYEGVSWFGVGSTSSGGGVTATVSGGEAIMGSSSTSAAQMVRRYNAVGKTYPSGTYSQYGASSIDQFCQILYEEATAEGVRPEVVFAQAMHETGWLQFGGDVKASQCNFAGIGATGGGAAGASFNTYGANSVRMGLRAQVQHLKAYASTDSCKNAIVDPRFNLVTRGSAATVQALSGKWATGSGYGDALVTQIGALLEA